MMVKRDDAWRRPVGGWLLGCAAMVAIMVVIGALTRLTHSGLSMVHWRPVTGWLPPLDEAAWMAAFEAYKSYPEYQKVNLGMTLAEYKSIFWLEYIHRVWGRCLGLAFALPYIVLAFRHRLPAWLHKRLVMLFILGGAQGVLGWYMVKSGLVDRPEVSPYRLAAHLVFAFLLFGALLVQGVALLWPRQQPVVPALRRSARSILALVAVTVVSGGLVAGLRAGYAFNDFPTMAGQWWPDGLIALQPAWRNFFENVLTVQFQHRILAYIIGMSSVAWAIAARWIQPTGVLRPIATGIAGLVVLQVALGVTTLLTHVNLVIATLHQATALMLFGAWVVANYYAGTTSVPELEHEASGSHQGS